MRDAGWAMDLADEREAQAREACSARPRVVVIGDAFVDEYVYADRVRLNPEAPTLCVTTGEREIRTALGGAANVFANLNAMCDSNRVFVDRMWSSPEAEWPVKRRYVADDRVLFRADVWDKSLPYDTHMLRLRLNGAAAIVVADYGKGAVTDEVWRAVADAGVPVFAHTKGSPLECHPDARTWTFFVNESEYDRESEDYYHWHAEIAGRVVTTYGADGADLCVRGIRPYPLRVPAFPANVVDVCGAGDSFMAAYVAAWVRGERDVEALLRAGCAAGAAAVERFGTSVVSWDDVEARLCPYATREEYDAQDGVDWDEVFDEVLL